MSTEAANRAAHNVARTVLDRRDTLEESKRFWTAPEPRNGHEVKKWWIKKDRLLERAGTAEEACKAALDEYEVSIRALAVESSRRGSPADPARVMGDK